MGKAAWVLLLGAGWVRGAAALESGSSTGPHEGKAVSQCVEERVRLLEGDLARLREEYLERDPELAARLGEALENLRFSASDRRPVAEKFSRMRKLCGAGAMGSVRLEARNAEADIEAVIAALKEKPKPPSDPSPPSPGPGPVDPGPDSDDPSDPDEGTPVQEPEDGPTEGPNLPPFPVKPLPESRPVDCPVVLRLQDPFSAEARPWGNRVPIDPEKCAVLKPRGERIPPEYESYVLAYWSRLSGSAR